MAGKTKVYTPNPSFAGVRNTIQGEVVFEDGVGRATKKQADELVANYGYSLEPFQEEASEEMKMDTETQLSQANEKVEQLGRIIKTLKDKLKKANLLKTELLAKVKQLEADNKSLVEQLSQSDDTSDEGGN